MICEKYETRQSGAMAEDEFARHLRTCAACREQAALDERLDREIVSLRHPVETEPLWGRIETSLREEKARPAVGAAKAVPPRRLWTAFFWRRRPLLIPAAAALLLAVVLGLLWLPKPAPPSGLLVGDVLAKAEIAEQAYRSAIEALERQARPKIASMDLSMMSLYRGKLTVIDAQIERCRTALSENRANAHIQRYLLAALQDKQQTLTDVLGAKN
ncbi:MAG: hypothetical protein NTZ26_07655 [Candidatus Aminicenantes bacterium]|nr:hypothetical protein [Candidatus Aminicenantes bacterium]